MKANFKILLVEDMESFRDAVTQLLGVYNDVHGVSDIQSAKQALQKAAFDVVILDKGLPDGDGISLISEIKDINPNAVVIMLTSDSDFSTVKRCIALGADDYVIKSDNIIPDLLVRIPVAVSKAASNRRLITLEQQVKDAFRYEIVGKSPATMQLRESILDLRGTSAHVLITGESGTGKELIARRLNAIEDDGKRPFVAINCGAIPENLLESELFGHKKGSFTGATQDRPGRFELAHNGDLFLDEIGEMPLSAQVRLLRVIQEGEFTRVGDDRTIKVKCRVIAATNKDLHKMMASGEFREDLFYRVAVIPLHLPPLRDRDDDISLLAQHFLRTFAEKSGKSDLHFSQAALHTLTSYRWPGNVRELMNAVEHGVALSSSAEVDTVHLPPRLLQSLDYLPPVQDRPATLAEVEKHYILKVLRETNGSQKKACKILDLSKTTLYRRLKEYDIQPKDSKEMDSSHQA